MSDLLVAGAFLAFLVGLAIAAPIWGYDSRDGIDSDYTTSRVTRPGDRLAGPEGSPAGPAVDGELPG